MCEQMSRVGVLIRNQQICKDCANVELGLLWLGIDTLPEEASCGKIG